MASSACFDCNICLEFVHEPVVTLCGHLYCWPCLYKWFHFQSTSISSYENTQCPVCKSSISPSTVVPLYGRGEPKPRSKTESKGPILDMIIPPRPPACGTTMADRRPAQQRVTYQGPYSDFYEEDSQAGVFGSGVSGGTGSDGIQYGMLGDMVYARVFGNSDSLYAYPNMYSLGRNSSRLRWQEMQADKCLNRIYLFLLCCFVLCLIVF